MTLQETRLDILARGILMNEGKIPGEDIINVTLMKFDVDGLRAEASFKVNRVTYVEDYAYSVIIKEKASLIEQFLIKRHAQDINSCEHEPVMIGNRKACACCMGNFGDRIVLDINKN